MHKKHKIINLAYANEETTGYLEVQQHSSRCESSCS